MKQCERIIVADDHPMFRDALANRLRAAYPEAEIVEAATLMHALEQARAGHPPSMLLLDLMFPGMEGAKSISDIRREFPAMCIIVVTMHEDAVSAEQVLDAGADGYLGKGLSSEDIIAGIRAIREGEYVVSLAPGADAFFELPPLTPRQLDVLQLLCENKPNKLIARELDLSHFTVRNHVSTLMRYLKVKRRSEIGRRAQALGLIATGNSEA